MTPPQTQDPIAELANSVVQLIETRYDSVVAALPLTRQQHNQVFQAGTQMAHEVLGKVIHDVSVLLQSKLADQRAEFEREKQSIAKAVAQTGAPMNLEVLPSCPEGLPVLASEIENHK